jgi:uncharacterized protein YkwD
MLRARSASGRVRRAVIIVIALSSVVGLAAGCTPRDSPVADVVMVNQARAARGLGPLRWHGELAAKAQDWARYMASQGRLIHSTLTAGISPGWNALAENVGYGTSVASVHDGFMASKMHRDSILSSRYREIGVGVVSSGGRIWVVEVFRG